MKFSKSVLIAALFSCVAWLASVAPVLVKRGGHSALAPAPWTFNASPQKLIRSVALRSVAPAALRAHGGHRSGVALEGVTGATRTAAWPGQLNGRRQSRTAALKVGGHDDGQTADPAAQNLKFTTALKSLQNGDTDEFHKVWDSLPIEITEPVEMKASGSYLLALKKQLQRLTFESYLNVLRTDDPLLTEEDIQNFAMWFQSKYPDFDSNTKIALEAIKNFEKGSGWAASIMDLDSKKGQHPDFVSSLNKALGSTHESAKYTALGKVARSLSMHFRLLDLMGAIEVDEAYQAYYNTIKTELEKSGF